MIWKIFARQPGWYKDSEDYARECYRSGVIAVGWNEVGDLNKIASFEELKKKMPNKRRNNARNIAQCAGWLWAFRNSVKRGHIVVCPDRDSGRYYVGRVISDKVFFDKSLLGGRCRFAHRRKIQWLRILKREEAKRRWGDRFGGQQTVTQIKSRDGQLKELLGRGRKTFILRARLPSRPDMEWGRAAEVRAMKWLKERGYAPKDVSHLNRGWDIECKEDKFEVKGRKSWSTAIRLTENEWSAARRHKGSYTLLIFTAPTLDKLNRASPVQIPDPARTESWARRVTYEYVLAE